MANLAILGHPTRGSEVIALLKMLGGKEEDIYIKELKQVGVTLSMKKGL